jgi:hypothetical protein
MQIERGQASADDFMAGIVSMITELVKTYHFISEDEKNRFAGSRPEGADRHLSTLRQACL